MRSLCQKQSYLAGVLVFASIILQGCARVETAQLESDKRVELSCLSEVSFSGSESTEGLAYVAGTFEIFANPSRFDGKRVVVTGVLRPENYRSMLFPSMEHYEHRILSSRLQFVAPPCISEGRLEQYMSLDGRYVQIDGVFEATVPGSVGGGLGGFSEIYEIRSVGD